jgi:hypothetical protein
MKQAEAILQLIRTMKKGEQRYIRDQLNVGIQTRKVKIQIQPQRHGIDYGGRCGGDSARCGG